MSSHKSRIAKLETAQPAQVNKYLCVIHPDHEAEGYTVTDIGGGNPQRIGSRAELEALEARPDVDLTIIQIVYASPAGDR